MVSVKLYDNSIISITGTRLIVIKDLIVEFFGHSLPSPSFQTSPCLSEIRNIKKINHKPRSSSRPTNKTKDGTTSGLMDRDFRSLKYRKINRKPRSSSRPTNRTKDGKTSEPMDRDFRSYFSFSMAKTSTSVLSFA